MLFFFSEFVIDSLHFPVGAGEACDLLTLFLRSKDRSLRQLLQVLLLLL